MYDFSSLTVDLHIKLMGNSNPLSRPSDYLESIGSCVEEARAELVDEARRRLFINAAVVSSLAYSDQPNEKLLQLTGADHDIYMAQRCIFPVGQNQNYIVATTIEEDVIFIGLRGTQGPHVGDWTRNLSLLPMAVDGGHIHTGFWHCAKEVSTQLLQELVSKGKKIVITGHSKGAAAAIALLLYMLCNPLLFNEQFILDQVECVAFAPPLLGDRQLAEFVHSKRWGHLFHSIVNYVSYIISATVALKAIIVKNYAHSF